MNRFGESRYREWYEWFIMPLWITVISIVIVAEVLQEKKNYAWLVRESNFRLGKNSTLASTCRTVRRLRFK
jgi:hypothetical protein